jgi:hypothetical protein
MKLLRHNLNFNLKAYLPVTFLAMAISIIAVWYFYNVGTLTSYNDARAHLNLARLVFDNQKPGLAQLGGVWLPLQHWLMLPFVWVDSWWQSGFAGAIVSMVSYTLSGAFIFALAKLITGRVGSSLVAALVFLLNANALYMQSVPMSEMLLILFFILTAYCLARWAEENNTLWLIASAASIMGATLTRYDGWFLLIWSAGVVGLRLLFLIRQRHITWAQVESFLVAFMTLAAVGVLFWLGWNTVIYGEPFYFAFGPFSARAQQEAIATSGELHTAGNLRLSLRAYGWAMFDNLGPLATTLFISGLVLCPPLWPREKRAMLLMSTTLISPLVFHIMSLYGGHSILMTPELGLADPSKPGSDWFNVRYGLVMLPAAAIFGTYYLKHRFWQVMIILWLVGQAYVSLAAMDMITLLDATHGSSSLTVDREAKWLARQVSQDDLIMLSLAHHNALAYETGMPLRQYIHEGTDKMWREALINPAATIEWLVMMNGDVGDPLYDSFIKQGQGNFYKNYTLAFRGEFLNIYQRTDFVISEGAELYYKGQPFRFVGVNAYNLLYENPDNMRRTIREAKKYGFTVIRFWAFGEGFPGAMQPQAGVLDEERALRLDLLLAAAREENIRVIPVLGNYWHDYGGAPHYLGWLGLKGTTLRERNSFFTNPDAKHLYRNYMEKIVQRQNAINEIWYKDDPTILAWEIINEPRSAGREQQAIVLAWLDEMGRYVRSLDKKHLILNGIEGFIDGVYEDPSGPEMTAGNSMASINIASGHFYRKYLQDKQDPEQITAVLEAWTQKTHLLNKPLIIGEAGFPHEVDVDRGQWISLLLTSAAANNISGVLLWNWSLTAHEAHDISPLAPVDQQLLTQLKPLIPTVTFE